MPLPTTAACSSRIKAMAMKMVWEAWRMGWWSNSHEGISVVEEEQELYEDAVRDLVGSRGSVEMQMVALIGVFAATGLVPVEEAAFAALVTIYALLLSWVAFPRYAEEAAAVVVATEGARRRRKAYVGLGLAVGLFLPLGFALGGFSRGNAPAAARAAASHLFLFSAQLLSEMAMSRHSFRFCAPLRLLVTLLYSARRLSVLSLWLRLAFLPPIGTRQDDFGTLFGQCLAVANIVYCNINVFGIVIPRLLLRAFERYIVAKNAHYASRHEPLQQSKSLVGSMVSSDVNERQNEIESEMENNMTTISKED